MTSVPVVMVVLRPAAQEDFKLAAVDSAGVTGGADTEKSQRGPMTVPWQWRLSWTLEAASEDLRLECLTTP